ncbi:sensor histidine kinase [Baia soyae]|nr:HAMP domain-containing sensor histidine kinase [Baia soyae]
MMFVLTNHYILPSLGIKDGWQYSRWIIIFSFVVFILSLFRHGFLRTRIRIERQHISSLQQLTSEASMLNQAIRNDQGRIKWYGDKIKTYAMATDQKVLEEDMNTILYAYQRMQDTMSRIQQKTKEHDLHLEKNSVLDIVKHCLNRLKDHLHASGVDIQIQCVDPSLVSWCDRLQIEETLHNIISNAIEAMPYGGVLTVQIDESKKKVLLSIKDTGMGIPKKHLTRILEPFFSTKLNSRENFGLGLSFCYHVMKKHKGNIDFDTKEGEGTTVYLSFPKKMRR